MTERFEVTVQYSTDGCISDVQIHDNESPLMIPENIGLFNLGPELAGILNEFDRRLKELEDKDGLD